MENEKAIMTNGIPQCPHCKRPTKRTGSSGGRTTLAYYPPSYDENGNNTNPDRNTTTRSWTCLECGKSYNTASSIDGCYYK